MPEYELAASMAYLSGFNPGSLSSTTSCLSPSNQSHYAYLKIDLIESVKEARLFT
jgi:hypothetical protein